jgi:8-oxo-dGTP pyrophosphatase MutT (NUDIX family)
LVPGIVHFCSSRGGAALAKGSCFCLAVAAVVKSARLSAGIILVRETPGGLRWLLLRAYRNWDFPKGLVEAGEEPLAAAIRETAEETGIKDLEFAWGYGYAETAPYAANKVARYFLARTETDNVVLAPNPELGRAEHHEFRWLDLDQARALAPPRLRRVLEWAADRVQAKP